MERLGEDCFSGVLFFLKRYGAPPELLWGETMRGFWKASRWGILALTCLFFMAAKMPAPTPDDAKWLLEVDPSIKVLTLAGTPYQRGLIYGGSLQKEIKEVIGLWKKNLSDTFQMDADRFITNFLKKTDYVTDIKKWVPELLEEVAGIAEGSKLDFNTLLVYQFFDEVYINGNDIAFPGKPVINEIGRCATLGLQRQNNHPVITSQNLDIGSFYKKYQVILHIKHENTPVESVNYTVAGSTAAYLGINSFGVAVNANSVMQLSHRTQGVPTTVIISKLLSLQTRQDMIDFLQKVPHASGQNYMISDASGISDYECSAYRVTEYKNDENPHFIIYTNHPLANDDISKKPVNVGKTTAKEMSQWSKLRYDAMVKKMKDNDTKNPEALLPLILDSYPVCHGSTLSRTTMMLSDRPKMIIRAASPKPFFY